MFIIIWRGLGIFVIAITLVSLVLTDYVVNTLSRDMSYFNAHGWPKLLGFWVASGLIYLIARWRKGAGDSLFFLPMGFWSGVMFVLGICFSLIVFPPERDETLEVSAAEQNKSQKAVEPLPEKFAWSGTEKELAEFKAEHSPAPRTPPPARPVRIFRPGTLTLQAIFYSPKASSAVINAKTVMPGDKIGGYTVMAIEEQSVSLMSTNGTNRELKLADVKAH